MHSAEPTSPSTSPKRQSQAYEKFQSLAANADNGYREIAKYYEQQRQRGEGHRIPEPKGLKAQPDSAESLAMLAVLYSKQNKNKEAIPLYRKLLELTGNNLNVSRDLAAALVENGEYADALKILEEIAKNPSLADDANIQILLGKALFGLRKYSEALSAFQSVTNADLNALEAQLLSRPGLRRNREVCRSGKDLRRAYWTGRTATPRICETIVSFSSSTLPPTTWKWGITRKPSLCTRRWSKATPSGQIPSC